MGSHRTMWVPAVSVMPAPPALQANPTREGSGGWGLTCEFRRLAMVGPKRELAGPGAAPRAFRCTNSTRTHELPTTGSEPAWLAPHR